jgi:HSP20 family protein
MSNNKYMPTTATNFNQSLFNSLWKRNIGQMVGADISVTVPAVNVSELENEFLIELAAPGLTKQDFQVKIEKDLLTISSEKSKQIVEGEGTRFTRKEFNYSAFTRSFHLPEGIKPDHIKGSYENGVLKVSLPKDQEWLSKKIKQIEIK